MASTMSSLGLNAFAQADASSTAGTAALFGVMFHLAIRKIEFELFMFHFIFAFIASFFGLICAFVSLGNYSVLGGFAKALLFASAFNTGLLVSIGTYRLVFHPCRKFPGPLPAKLSRFYATKLAAKDVQFYKELAKMHEQYGDFVRTGTASKDF